MIFRSQDLGSRLGYRETEMEALGTNRRDLVSRFEESLSLIWNISRRSPKNWLIGYPGEQQARLYF